MVYYINGPIDGILYTLYIVFTFDHIQIEHFSTLKKNKGIEKNLTFI